jgi:multidrug efflux system membrane fusion protein
MRPVSIGLAALVAFALYVLVFERETLMRVAGASDPAVSSVVPADAPAAVPSAAADPAVSVVAMRSAARVIDGAVLLRGRTEAARQVEVRSETDGKVVSAPLRKGTFVEDGQLLCRLDPGTRAVALDEARARLIEAQARAPEAEARVAESEAMLAESRIVDTAATRLGESGFASQRNVVAARAGVEASLAGVQAAMSGVDSARAGIQAAQATVATVEKEIERLEILTPFEGLLESDTAELGTLLQPGDLCATVIQLDPIKLVGFVPEVEVDKVVVGAGARARLASGRQVQGRVTFLSRASDAETRTFRTEVAVPNADLAIRDGQTAEIVIASDGRDAHLLPQSALTLDDDGGLGVRLVGEGSIVRFAAVGLLRDTPDGVWVAGLPPEAAVIVVGQEFVSDGVPVAVTWTADPEPVAAVNVSDTAAGVMR